MEKFQKEATLKDMGRPRLFILVPVVLIFLSLLFSSTNFAQTASPSPSPSPTTLISQAKPAVQVQNHEKSATPSASPEVQALAKKPAKSYSIALIGDSMIETMGEQTEYLQKSLSAKYPNFEFKLYNYGIGAQNVEQGLNRFNQPFSYKTRNYPPLTEVKPDILIVGSFSYNPFPEHDRAKHQRLLQSLINQARGSAKKVYLLAEIAPLKTGFGEGPGGINWPQARAELQAIQIIELLENAVNLAKMENVPLINAFQASKVDGNYGNKQYVNSHDGIHPSVKGHIFMANFIANTLTFK